MDTGFKHIDRGKNKSAVLLPGWATDYRVFERVDIEYDYIVPVRMDTKDIFRAFPIEAAVKRRPVTLIGWSMGGILAAQLMLEYPEAIERVIFLGVKENYPVSQMDKMKTLLLRDKERYLSGFYRKCFTGHDGGDMEWFNSGLREQYFKCTDIAVLSCHLDYLAEHPVPVAGLKKYGERLTFIHGKNDAIVAPGETLSLRREFKKSHFADLAGVGHAVFLHAGFKSLADKYAYEKCNKK